MVVFSTGSYRFVSSNQSFLFSLYNINGYAPVKLNIRLSRYSYAITSGSSYGPFFGGGADLIIRNNAGSNQNSFTHCGNTYPLPPVDFMQDPSNSLPLMLKCFTRQRHKAFMQNYIY